MARKLMVQGTGSGVGKSALVAAFCRIFAELGLKVAPFKAQNMSLNSAVTKGGYEIGRAQYFQAVVAGAEPSPDMNPVLLKPLSGSCSHVVLQGRPWGKLDGNNFLKSRKLLQQKVMESFSRLDEQYDVIVLEGAGSPAEINLRERDIVNMEMAKKAGAPVLLVGDIDRGGVFAWLKGTIDLLASDERERIKGCIINKFRGDIAMLSDGLREFERLAGKPIIGVVPYVERTGVEEEDGLVLDERASLPGTSPWCSARRVQDALLRIAVIKLPHISNFTDFDALSLEPDVALEFRSPHEPLDGVDVVILPGSRNVIGDLMALRSAGAEKEIARARENGAVIVGVCGGYQMLGLEIRDPAKVEGEAAFVAGLGHLGVVSELKESKTVRRVKGYSELYRAAFSGYEIHHGQTTAVRPERLFSRITQVEDSAVDLIDGYCSIDGKVWGTYVHGIFDEAVFRQAFLTWVRSSRGLMAKTYASARTGSRFDAFATFVETVKKSVDIEFVLDLVGLKGAGHDREDEKPRRF